MKNGTHRFSQNRQSFDPFINSYMLQGAGIIVEKKK